MALLIHDCDSCESRDTCEHQVDKQYDTLVCLAVKKDPLAFVRVASKGRGSTIKIIGNIIDDIWFDYEEFFRDENQSN